MIFLKPYKRYFDFSGRSTRKEYWLFALFFVAVVIAMHGLDRVLHLVDEASGSGLLSTLFYLASSLPILAVSVRRLHDSDRNAAWVLLWLAPMVVAQDTLINHPLLFAKLYGISLTGDFHVFSIGNLAWWDMLFFASLIALPLGTIWFIVLMCLKGSKGKNRFGMAEK